MSIHRPDSSYGEQSSQPSGAVVGWGCDQKWSGMGFARGKLGDLCWVLIQPWILHPFCVYWNQEDKGQNVFKKKWKEFLFYWRLKKKKKKKLSSVQNVENKNKCALSSWGRESESSCCVPGHFLHQLLEHFRFHHLPWESQECPQLANHEKAAENWVKTLKNQAKPLLPCSYKWERNS